MLAEKFDLVDSSLSPKVAERIEQVGAKMTERNLDAVPIGQVWKMTAHISGTSSTVVPFSVTCLRDWLTMLR